MKRPTSSDSRVQERFQRVCCLTKAPERARDDRVRDGLLLVDDLPVAQDAVGQRAVVAEGRLDTEEGLVLPPLHPGQDRLALVGREAARAAGDGVEDGLRRLDDAEGDEVAHRLHPRQPALADVQHVGVAADGADLRVGQRLDEHAQRVGLDRRVGVHEDDHLGLGRADAGRHGGALAAVLGEVDHPDATVGLGGDLLHLGERPVGRAVVDGDQFELLRRVAERQQ